MAPPRGKRLAVLAAAAALVMLGAAAFVFRGHLVEEYWLWRLERSNESQRVLAARTLGEMRSVRAIPHLIQIYFRGPRAPIVMDIPPRQTSHEQARLDMVCQTALAKTGAPAIPALSIAFETDSHARIAAQCALQRIGAPAVPVLTRALRSSNDELSMASAVVLLCIGPDTKDAVPALIEVLKRDDAGVRSHAAQALGKIGPAASAAVPTLTEALSDGHSGVYRSAWLALQEIQGK